MVGENEIKEKVIKKNLIALRVKEKVNKND